MVGATFVSKPLSSFVLAAKVRGGGGFRLPCGASSRGHTGTCVVSKCRRLQGVFS